MCDEKYVLRFIFLAYGYSIIPAPSLKQLFFSTESYLYKNLVVYMFVGLFLDSLFCSNNHFLILMPILHCFDYYSFILNL